MKKPRREVAYLLAVLLIPGCMKPLPPGASLSLTATKTGANTHVCWTVEVYGFGNGIGTQDLIDNNIDWTPAAARIDDLGACTHPTSGKEGRSFNVYYAYPAGAGTTVSGTVTNNGNKKDVSFRHPPGGAKDVPALPLNVKGGVYALVDTEKPNAPEMIFDQDPALGRVLIVKNTGNLPLRIQSLQICTSATVVPPSQFTYSNPSIAGLPWVTVISTNTDLSPNQSQTFNVSDALITQNAYARAQYKGTSVSDPSDYVVGMVPAGFAVPALAPWAAAALAFTLGGVGFMVLRSRGSAPRTT